MIPPAPPMLAAPAPPGPIVPPGPLAVALLIAPAAWPPLAAPASAMAFSPELLHASPAKMRAATTVEILNMGANIGHVYWVGLSICSTQDRRMNLPCHLGWWLQRRPRLALHHQDCPPRGILLQASPTKPDTKRAATVVEFLSIASPMCSPTRRQDQRSIQGIVHIVEHKTMVSPGQLQEAGKA
jgi:hypothetical protein